VHSPDPARPVTFRSQRIQETCGHSHSLGTLRAGYALRRPARTEIVETGENKKVLSEKFITQVYPLLD